MKTILSVGAGIFSRAIIPLTVVMMLAGPPVARAGLQMDMHLYGAYFCYPWLSTNSTSPSPTNTAYFVWSPSSTINTGIHFQLNPDNSIDGSGSSVYSDYASFIHEITNGNWTLLVTNAAGTNQYTFTVTVPDTITSNLFASVNITAPASGQINVTNTPTFTWTGPAGWQGTLNVYDNSVDNNGNYTYVTSANLTPDQTSWPSSTSLPNGTNNFSVNYVSNTTAIVTVSTPVDNLSNPFPGFSFISTIESDANVDFVVGSTTELVVNGGFETGDLTGWTDDGSSSVATDATAVHSGTYGVENGSVGSLGYLSQTLATTPGATYLLSFWLNSPDGETPNEFQVSWNGTVLFDETDLPALGWTNMQFVVTATGASTVLEFGFRDDPSYLGLDDVSVSPTQAGGRHTLIAHYAFDDSSNLGHDSSGNGNDMSGETWWGPQHMFATDAEAGGGAVQFFGTDAMTANGQTLTNLDAVLAGSFTFSAWVKTTVTNGAAYNNAFYGAAIFWAYNDHGNTNDTIPLSITGSKAAFTTRGGDSGLSDSLHSLTSVNDGNYHLITVTRDQSTGEKKIYVDGNFEASQTGTTDPLNGNNYNLTIGGWAYLLESDSTVTNYSSYNGLLDDVQIYSGVLSDAEVASQFANPGVTIPNVAGGGAGGLVAHYDFDEGTVLAADVSGNNNNIVYAGNFGGSGPQTDTNNVNPNGSGSASFDGGSYLTASSNLLATLAGSFSISLWVKTTQNNGHPYDYAFNGDGIISADVGGVANDLVPVALTGGQVAFNTGNTTYGYDDTINSSATVNDGQWHHVVVSRNQPTGEKFIYIDGGLDTSDVDATNLLNDPKILTIGCLADASNPDPASPSSTGRNGYIGLLDDVQVYNRVLNADEVAFLYNNPGATLSGATTITPYPVDVSLQFSIIRSQDPNFGEIYGGGVSFNSVNPAPTTTNSVHSPHDYFNTEQYPGSGTGSGAILSSLSDVINEFTNGLWKIYINQGSPTQQVYSFQVSITGLDTNLLQAVRILSPTNGALNVGANVPFYWTGPTNFSSLSLDLAGVVNLLSLPLTATNWAAAPTLSNGSQFFDLNYNSNNFPGVTFTTPVDASSNPVRTWSTSVNLSSEAFSLFFVGPNPTELVNAQCVGTNFQFSFLSQTSVTNSIQYRTNLAVGNWQTYTNITGDGSLKSIPIPVSVFNGSKQGFVRISMQ